MSEKAEVCWMPVTEIQSGADHNSGSPITNVATICLISSSQLSDAFTAFYLGLESYVMQYHFYLL